MELLVNQGIKKIEPLFQRYLLAVIIILLSYGAIIYFARNAATHDENDNVTRVFNTILPVLASWIGTVIAFYFGKESFDSANTQIREANTQLYEMIKKLTPEEMAKNPIVGIMRRFSEIVCYKIPEGKSDIDIKLQEIYDAMIIGKVSRLPILNFNDTVRYIIHDSRIQKYLFNNHIESREPTLFDFIEYYKKEAIEYGLNKGFVVVSATTSVEEAKKTLEKCTTCQDIFITGSGSEKEPIIGWVSNIRLSKYLLG